MMLGTATRYELQLNHKFTGSDWKADTIKPPRERNDHIHQFAVIVFQSPVPSTVEPAPHAPMPDPVCQIAQNDSAIEPIAVYTEPEVLADKQVCYILDDGNAANGGRPLNENEIRNLEMLLSYFEGIEIPLSKTALRHGLELMIQELNQPSNIISASKSKLSEIRGVSDSLADVVHSRFDDSIRKAIENGLRLNQIPIIESDGTLMLDEDKTDELKLEIMM
jgi:hypothetical protein